MKYKIYKVSNKEIDTWECMNCGMIDENEESNKMSYSISNYCYKCVLGLKAIPLKPNEIDALETKIQEKLEGIKLRKDRNYFEYSMDGIIEHWRMYNIL